jgi:hypothetical protein
MEFVTAGILLVIAAIANESAKRLSERRVSKQNQYMAISVHLAELRKNTTASHVVTGYRSEEESLLMTEQAKLHRWLKKEHNGEVLALILMPLGFACVVATLLPFEFFENAADAIEGSWFTAWDVDSIGLAVGLWVVGMVTAFAGVVIGFVSRRA